MKYITIFFSIAISFLFISNTYSQFNPLKTGERILKRAERNTERRMENTANQVIDKKIDSAIKGDNFRKKEQSKSTLKPEAEANPKTESKIESVNSNSTTTVTETTVTTTTTTTTTKTVNKENGSPESSNAIKKKSENTKKAESGRAKGSLLPPS